MCTTAVSYCTAQYMRSLLCIASCKRNQFDLVWVRNNLRKTLFRERWTGGKKKWEKKSEERFCCLCTCEWGCISSWKEEANSPLWLHSITPLRGLSQHILYSCVHATCTHACMVFCSVMWNLWNLHVVNRHNAKEVMVVFFFFSSLSVCCLCMKQRAGELDSGADGKMSVPTLESVLDTMWQDTCA